MKKNGTFPTGSAPEISTISAPSLNKSKPPGPVEALSKSLATPSKFDDKEKEKTGDLTFDFLQENSG
jgi:hypothetical protein